MNIQVERAPESLDQGHHTGLGARADGEPGPPDLRTLTRLARRYRARGRATPGGWRTGSAAATARTAPIGEPARRGAHCRPGERRSPPCAGRRRRDKSPCVCTKTRPGARDDSHCIWQGHPGRVDPSETLDGQLDSSDERRPVTGAEHAFQGGRANILFQTVKPGWHHRFAQTRLQLRPRVPREVPGKATAAVGFESARVARRTRGVRSPVAGIPGAGAGEGRPRSARRRLSRSRRGGRASA